MDLSKEGGKGGGQHRGLVGKIVGWSLFWRYEADRLVRFVY